jgi:hypothetical protein
MKAFQLLRTRTCAPVLTLLITAPFVSGNTLAETIAPQSQDFAPTTRIEIQPGTQTPALVTVAPNSRCNLHPQGITDAAHSMSLFANSDGEIRFHVTAQRESDQAAQMQLDCVAADGKSTTFPLELSASASAPESQAKPLASIERKGATHRAGLSEIDAASLSGEELALRSYPPRPDSTVSPEAYSTWLHVVSQPVTMVPAGVMTRPEVSHNHGQIQAGTGTSSNWSGYELRGDNRTYDVVEGQWYVPSVSSEFGVHAYSAYWVGLDGDGISDLVQAGTEQEYYDFSIFSFSNYYAWSELLPNQPSESVISGIPVAPGNQVFTEVWVGNSNGALNASGGYGLFYVHNLTTGEATEFETCLCGTVFLGREAEWIMERPTVNKVLPALADYGAAITSSAYAETVAGPWTTYQPSSHINITMTNGSDILSTVQQDGSTSMYFLWKNFQ